MLWGLGGYLPLADLMEILGPAIDTCSDECEFGFLGTALPDMMPYLSRFQHGVITGVDVAAIPRVLDVDDLDGDGDTAELIPDYGNFPVRGPLTLDMPLRMELDVPAFLPTVESARFDRVTRTFSGDAVTGADLYRVTLQAGAVRWQVLAPAGNPGFVLPGPAPGYADLTSEPALRVDAWDTRNGLDLDDLVEFNGTNLDRVDHLVRGFSTVMLNQPAGMGCDCDPACSVGGASSTGSLACVVMLGLWLLWRRRRRG